MTFVSNSLALTIFLDPLGIQNATSKTNLYLGKDTLLHTNRKLQERINKTPLTCCDKRAIRRRNSE